MVTVKHDFTDVNSWLEAQKHFFGEEVLAQFNSAIEIAQQYYQNQKFYPTNVDLLKHALTCANTVAELNLFPEAVIATILFALPRYCPTWREELHLFDKKIIELIDGVNRVIQIRKLGAIVDETGQQKNEQMEVIRKMLLAMASDIRVVLILLVGRGELMLHLKSCNDANMREKIARETMEIFAPLANRLGVWQIKWELEDLSFKYLHPEQYKRIASLLEETREERLEYMERMKDFISNQMEESGITRYQVSGRAKHIYSIWKKMKQKGYEFDGLFDIRAVRVLVPEIKDCYTVLGIVHTKYSPIPGEFDDYISKPKPNDYQSLHTCVIGPDNRVVEIQIRTFAMHDHAEYGVAAHWRYKESGESGRDSHSGDFVAKMAWLRQILDWRDGVFKENKDIATAFKNEAFSDTIYVMTPTGKVISLPHGSTPIDFAYHIHRDVGHKCRGAKVDGQIVPLSTVLQNGQHVEILTVKEGAPSINWLYDGLVRSHKAISSIRRYIRDQNNEEFLDSGTEIFERELSKFVANVRPDVDEVVAKLGYDNDKNLQIALGRGDVSPKDMREALRKIVDQREPVAIQTLEEEMAFSNQQTDSEPDANRRIEGILVDGVSGIMTHIAKCCKPIPQDTIIGFVTQGKGVAIHRSSCHEIRRQAKFYPNKVVPVSWGGNIARAVFNADIEVIANDRPGLLRDLTEVFAVEKIFIVGSRSSSKNNRAYMIFTMRIQGAEFNFTHLVNKILEIDGVIEAIRK